MRIEHLGVVAVALLSLSACSKKHSGDFRPDRLRPGDGVATGRVHIALNGQDVTDKCEVCFETTRNIPCLRLKADGLVVVGLESGPTWFYRVACSAKGDHQYRFPDAKFTVPEGGRVYFGDIDIAWTHDSASPLAQVFRKDTASDGSAIMTVTGDADAATAAYRAIVKEDKLPLTRMLVEPEPPSGG